LLLGSRVCRDTVRFPAAKVYEAFTLMLDPVPVLIIPIPPAVAKGAVIDPGLLPVRVILLAIPGVFPPPKKVITFATPGPPGEEFVIAILLSTNVPFFRETRRGAFNARVLVPVTADWSVNF